MFTKRILVHTLPAASFVVAAAFLAACSQAPASSASMPETDMRPAAEKAIRETEAGWNQAWAARDADKIASYWADDATLMMTNVAPIHGNADIRSGLKPMLEGSGLGLKFEADKVEVGRSGDIAYVQGHYEMHTTDPKSKKTMVEKGKYLTVYRKQPDGAWKAIEDINNADAPAEKP